VGHKGLEGALKARPQGRSDSEAPQSPVFLRFRRKKMCKTDQYDRKKASVLLWPLQAMRKKTLTQKYPKSTLKIHNGIL
jgi:hypothetical protein